MKKCPSCGSISQDSDLSCGVCGQDITGIVSRDLLLLETERQPAVEIKTKVHAKGLALLSIGVGTIGIGVYELVASGVIGLFLILAGLIVTVSVVNIDGGWFGYGDVPLKERERRAKDRWDKERLNQEREVKE